MSATLGLMGSAHAVQGVQRSGTAVLERDAVAVRLGLAAMCVPVPPVRVVVLAQQSFRPAVGKGGVLFSLAGIPAWFQPCYAKADRSRVVDYVTGGVTS